MTHQSGIFSGINAAEEVQSSPAGVCCDAEFSNDHGTGEVPEMAMTGTLKQFDAG